MNLVRLWVRLTFHQMSPWQRRLVAKFDTTSGQVTIWSDLWVRLIFGPTLGPVDIWSDVPPRMRLWVSLTFGQISGLVDLWSDVPSG